MYLYENTVDLNGYLGQIINITSINSPTNQGEFASLVTYVDDNSGVAATIIIENKSGYYIFHEPQHSSEEKPARE